MHAVTGVTRRPETDADLPFLLALYATTRAVELARVPWSDAEKRAFVAMQFEAQRRHYYHVYPDARFDILERDGAAIGRLYVHESDAEIRVVDITLAPAARNLGIGHALLEEILRGAGPDRPVVIHVERFNPARRLYERLGFTPAGGDDIYLRMEARPGSGH
jgi:ribosomal protein S18 acetylase RimI-like enzyme